MIFVEIDDKKVNVKSLLGVISFSILCGQKIKISSEGIDEEKAVNSLADLIENCFAVYEFFEEDEYI
jgi:catabolite repression HPr-like protein